MQFFAKTLLTCLFLSLFFTFSYAQNQTYKLHITFDNYPDETIWKVFNINDLTNPVTTGGPYPRNATYQLQNFVFDVTLAPGSYRFAIYDAANDGICCVYGSGSFSFKNPSLVELLGGGAFGASTYVDFTVTNACGSNSLPTITLSASPTSIVGSGTVALSASASDIDGNVTKVDFYRNAVLIGTDNTSPYTFSYSETSVGTHSYTAKATDNCSGIGTSSAVSVTVSSSNPCTSNPPPTVSISQPANNATVTAGTNLQITASASDNGTVTQVQFYNGTTLLGTSTTSPFSYTYTSIPAGTYTLTARATDNCGAVTTSSVVTITSSSGGGSTCNPWTLNCTTTGDISRTGRVGIGASNFLGDVSYLLYVKGGIRAEKMQLEMSAAGGWSDYVFAPDYRLMPLKQVAEYLKTHRHLPGMASETEMIAEGGINVGKIAAQQQAKIEELFLYVIELNKKVETLEKEVKTLRSGQKAQQVKQGKKQH